MVVAQSHSGRKEAGILPIGYPLLSGLYRPEGLHVCNTEQNLPHLITSMRNKEFIKQILYL